MRSELCDPAAGKGLRQWEKPLIDQIDLAADEPQLRTSDDSMAFCGLKPELGQGWAEPVKHSN
jgi:hypothetical protein